MVDERKYGEKYSNMNEMATFGFLVNALDGNRGGDGDEGSIFPRSDAEDMSKGARFIPGEVTLARRDGRRVSFIQKCSNPCCWYWQVDDGTRHHHFERTAFESVADSNEIPRVDGELKTNRVGPCPKCGNAHLHGGSSK